MEDEDLETDFLKSTSLYTSWKVFLYIQEYTYLPTSTL